MPKNAAAQYVCEICEKEYKFISGLSRHKKMCFQTKNKKEIYDLSSNQDENYINEYTYMTKEMIIDLIKENGEIKELLCKQSEKIEEKNKKISVMLPQINAVTNINNTYNTANIKQKFNVNIFLNEKCKDAINMDDFIKSLEISLDQLDITKNKGLAEGLISFNRK